MSTDAGERMARGELPLPDSVENCPFCGAGRDAQRRTSRDENVAQHSHQGRRVETIACEECGGALVSESRVQTRVSLPSRPRLVREIWEVPDDYVLSYCTGCEEVAGMHELVEDERELLEAIDEGEIKTTCCDAPGEFERERFEVPI